jgi:hypothetical protein
MGFDPLTGVQRDHPASAGLARYGEHDALEVARHVAGARSQRPRNRLFSLRRRRSAQPVADERPAAAPLASATSAVRA